MAGLGIILIPYIDLRKLGTRRRVKGDYFVYAKITKSFIDYNYRVQGQNPYRVECRYTDEELQQTYMFTSNPIWENPQRYVGQSVKLYCKKGFGGKYHVAVEELMEQDRES